MQIIYKMIILASNQQVEEKEAKHEVMIFKIIYK